MLPPPPPLGIDYPCINAPTRTPTQEINRYVKGFKDAAKHPKGTFVYMYEEVVVAFA